MLLKMLILFQASGVWSLRDVSLRAPEAVRAGDSLSLSCGFRLEQEHLYSVKFYQGDTEFYRYVPRDTPPTRVFALHNVKVDVSRSNSSAVTLADVQWDLTGVYQCEVSADAPLFHTGIKAAYVTVVEEPWTMPVLTAERTKYTLGEVIRANCTSWGGHPPANLTWYLNGRLVKHSRSIQSLFEVLYTAHEEGADTSVLRLETVASPDLFQDGRLRLRCIATQYTLYRRSAELDIHEDSPQSALVLGVVPTESLYIENKGISLDLAQKKLVIYLFLFLNLLNQKGLSLPIQVATSSWLAMATILMITLIIKQLLC